MFVEKEIFFLLLELLDFRSRCLPPFTLFFSTHRYSLSVDFDTIQARRHCDIRRASG